MILTRRRTGASASTFRRSLQGSFSDGEVLCYSIQNQMSTASVDPLSLYPLLADKVHDNPQLLLQMPTHQHWISQSTLHLHLPKYLLSTIVESNESPCNKPTPTLCAQDDGFDSTCGTSNRNASTWGGGGAV